MAVESHREPRIPQISRIAHSTFASAPLRGNLLIAQGNALGFEIVVGLRPVRAKDFVHVFLLPLQGVFSGNFHTQGVQWSLHPLRFPRFAGDGNPGLSYHWPLTFPSAVDLWFRPFSLLAKVELNDIAKVAIKAESRQKQSTKSPVSSAKPH